MIFGEKMSELNIHSVYMKRCLQLAANGKATCSPNPMVGAVVVHQGRIIGEGWHRKAGEPHAEPNAIRSVKDQHLLKDSTLYVSLEPCSHYGKTPPCVNLIIEMGIPRVVVGCLDAFPLVAGRGVKKMRAAGIDVTVGVDEAACLDLNRHFFHFHKNNRPYVILKWAETADGFMDISRKPGDQKESLKISSPFTQMLTHKLRSECDAILVGTNTAILDNPSLNVRSWAGKHPLRAVIDRQMVLSDTYSLLNGQIPTLVFTENQSKRVGKIAWIQIDFSNEPIKQLLNELYRRNLQTLIVEGGAQLHESFLKAGFWDEIHVETSTQVIGAGVASPDLSELSVLPRETKVFDSGIQCRKIRIFHSSDR